MLDNASLSSRRAWIEIKVESARLFYTEVALLTESVDRNDADLAGNKSCRVALLTESVDRNF